jgi:hypothetical protein
MHDYIGRDFKLENINNNSGIMILALRDIFDFI